MDDPIDMAAVREAANRIKKDHNDHWGECDEIPTPFELCISPECVVAEFTLRILDMPPEVREAVERWDAQSGNVGDDYKVAKWFVGVVKGAKSEQ